MGKPYMINRGAIGNILRNIFGNLMETPWEHDGNTLGRRGKKTKNPFLPHLSPSPICPLKTRLFVSAELFHWLHEISFSKTVHHRLSPGLIPIPKSWGTFPSYTWPIHLYYSLDEVPPKFNFVGLAYQGKGIVFKFNIKYNSLRYFLM